MLIPLFTDVAAAASVAVTSEYPFKCTIFGALEGGEPKAKFSFAPNDRYTRPRLTKAEAMGELAVTTPIAIPTPPTEVVVVDVCVVVVTLSFVSTLPDTHESEV